MDALRATGRDCEGRAGRFSWKLIKPFGVVVEGNAWGALEADERLTLSELLYNHGFLLLREQELDKAAFRGFCGALAPLLPEDHEANPVLAVKPEEGGFGTTELIFHRDLSYAEHPFQAIALHALDVVPGQTSTCIASGTRAYERLPPALRDRLSHLQVITALGTDPTRRIVESEMIMAPGWPRYVHKLVSPHPVTGLPVLELCPMSSVRVESLSAADSQALLEELFGYLLDEGNVYEHSWNNGDLLIWDNFATLHARRSLEGVERRTLQRLTLGKLSFPLAFPGFSMRKHTDTYQQQNYMGEKGARF